MDQRTGADATFLARAEALGARVSAKRSPGDEKSFADALLAEMRRDGLLSVAVPETFGGPGLDLAQIARITERISRLSGSAGLIYAMHMSQALAVVRHGTGAFFEDFQRRMVRDQILLASGTSEKGPGGDILTSIATLAPVADGRLGGRKESPNISYLDHAGAILLTANMAQPKGPNRQVLVVLEMPDVRVASLGNVGFMGMRGILNQPVALDFEAPFDAVFPGSFAPIARRTMTPCIHVLWAALWSGIAWNVINRARLFVRQELTAGQEATTLARHELSLIANQHAIMIAMIHDTITLYEGDPTHGNIALGSSARINRLKITCSELLIDICTRALRLVGIRGYALGSPYTLAEPLCDALSAPIMVSNTRLQMNTVAIEDFADESL